jgi:hypothetical protein
MRQVKPAIFAVLLIYCLCGHLHAQDDTSCNAPTPTPGQTDEQQEAAASGYLAACKAATAPDAHEVEAQAESDKKVEGDKKAKNDKDTRSGAEVDEAIDLDVLAFPDDQSKWQINDYLRWIDQKSCPKLLQSAKKGLAHRTIASQKTYLALIVQGVTQQNKCN